MTSTEQKPGTTPEAAPELYLIVGKLSDGEWHYMTGPASRDILERVLPGWQERTPTACIVRTSAALSEHI